MSNDPRTPTLAFARKRRGKRGGINGEMTPAPPLLLSQESVGVSAGAKSER